MWWNIEGCLGPKYLRYRGRNTVWENTKKVTLVWLINRKEAKRVCDPEKLRQKKKKKMS